MMKSIMFMTSMSIYRNIEIENVDSLQIHTDLATTLAHLAFVIFPTARAKIPRSETFRSISPLERFSAKRALVQVAKLRQGNNVELHSDSTGSESAQASGILHTLVMYFT
jgi:hypothetical protein